ncbi:cobalamin biosynthesis protein [Chlorobium sp. BLA1]|uniref:adenosylcobinamide-phosphate synthase CbiB n=1 Tax=Candidatus Chlorobium masyuteum TaxID=2716876 RepID=UPI00142280ED|nr:adenosylcobinamide-phosphate synthase CbiB [Candidatus Chlorobium masyuteum]NHQ60375.1 cobalamin biosynthesis protein [Candidatus Chlorobium masyuteum]
MTDALPEALVASAFLLDLSLGDPRWMPHPVRGIGWFALRLESLMRRSPLPLRVTGITTVIAVVGASAGTAWLLITCAVKLHPLGGAAMSIYLLYTSFAVRDLGDHAAAVERALIAGDINEARRKVSCIVGRDTQEMNAGGIALAATESVAENSVDGVTAPLFYALLLGPVGAIAYKAVNTLDSTFGYKNERYLAFGWASAKLDDLANWLPARVTVLFIMFGAAFNKLRVFDIFPAVRKSAKLHASPNAGYPEAAFAGALGVQFGGPRSYGGELHHAPILGVKTGECTPRTIRQSITLMRTTAIIFLLCGIGIRILLTHTTPIEIWIQ